MLSIVGVVKRFGGVTVLKGVSLSVAKGSIVSLLGPNGSGKTTLLRIVAGVLRPSSGEVVFRGGLMSYLPQELGLFKELSGWDNILFYARLYGLDKGYVLKRGKELLEKLELLNYAKAPVAKYSGGMARKLSLAIALLPDADLYVLDEPTTGLDPSSRHSVWELIEELKRSGKSVLLSTHYMEEAERLSDYVYLIHKGSIVAEGTVEELKKRYAPRTAIELHLYGDAKKAVGILKERGFDAYAYGDAVAKVYSASPREEVPKLISALYESGVYVKLLNIAEPTLEDVFIRLTGERLGE
ncbi:MAG: ABC transporter ATP-binding protein [Ignisphaera sp.]|nr:ABC transporter ATP-binding protein [Ignisphaera sp.]